MSSTPRPPTLLIVMGTSGSGKSTVGAALSSALECPFVDGDDLHPASNVDKMSHGHPLTDSDREPWLLKIRQTGLQLAITQTDSTLPHSKETESTAGSQVRKLAEIYETSHQTTTSKDLAAHHQHQRSAQSGGISNEQQVQGSSKHLAIIACSSLKLIYRRLLRGTISSFADPATTTPESEAELPTDLKVIHIYLDLSKELLEQRMANRKGHFMKLDMLYSQLNTLQKPEEDKELAVVVVRVERDTSTEDIVSNVVRQLRAKRVI